MNCWIDFPSYLSESFAPDTIGACIYVKGIEGFFLCEYGKEYTIVMTIAKGSGNLNDLPIEGNYHLIYSEDKYIVLAFYKSIYKAIISGDESKLSKAIMKCLDYWSGKKCKDKKDKKSDNIE